MTHLEMLTALAEANRNQDYAEAVRLRTALTTPTPCATRYAAQYLSEPEAEVVEAPVPAGIQYSNPRLYAVIDNWPSGRHRVKAMFTIQRDHKKGERALRVTENPKGGTNATKKLTYALQVRIVDGSDGRTYLLDMQFQQETITSQDPRFEMLMGFFA